jgi:hypothetical protein
MGASTDDREPLGRLFHEQGRVTVNAEREKPFNVRPWEGRTGEQQEIDMRGASAVAARAVADAGLENDRARMLLAAFGVHRGAIFDALAVAMAGAKYEDDRKRWRDALRALGGEEDDRG